MNINILEIAVAAVILLFCSGWLPERIRKEACGDGIAARFCGARIGTSAVDHCFSEGKHAGLYDGRGAMPDGHACTDCP